MLDRAVFESAINAIVEKLVRNYEPEKIVLYGSCARGTMHADSDIDMLIVKNTDKKRHIDRWLEVRRLTRDAGRGISFEPLILTPSELQERIKIGDFFVQEILKEGSVLF